MMRGFPQLRIFLKYFKPSVVPHHSAQHSKVVKLYRWYDGPSLNILTSKEVSDLLDYSPCVTLINRILISLVLNLLSTTNPLRSVCSMMINCNIDPE
jgi:hypothetical protein